MAQSSTTTHRYIAFLRAINVGGHTVKMDYLRALFEALGFANVATFIASGNVIFESPDQDARALEQQIEQHLKQALGYEVKTFIRSPAELESIASYVAFPTPDLTITSSLYIAFLQATPDDQARQKLLALRNAVDDFQIHGREVYWLCRTKLSESKAFSGALLEKTIRLPATMRNITTVKKLAAKYPASR